ncbi:hypothetical protein QYE76_007700 [Lolium multiflorum]|uniref:F-box domain-containing protein n=1 Tax=Lolium multiflorum TaxID=4521 RepID=A0AAD8QI54_LOLMU|nr:hypothetical protein QYE76_007700 [Lolium multiflorum]
MAGRERQRRRNNKLKRASWKSMILPGPTGVDHIPDHLLELVLVRVDSSLTLIRAAFACKRWRRIIADTSFLARFSSINPAYVLGHYHVVNPSHGDKLLPDGNYQVFVPDPSMADVIDRRHFSLDFLPDVNRGSSSLERPESRGRPPSSWELADSRGSLLLLYRLRTNMIGQLFFPDLVVCEPLSRRYQGIGYPPEMRRNLCFGAFLLDGVSVQGTGGCISMSNFRVIIAAFEYDPYGHGGLRACVFSGSDGGWSLGQRATGVPLPVPEFSVLTFVGRTQWSLYWAIQRDGVLLSLDETTAEFSLAEFPDAVVGMTHERSTLRIVGGEDGAVRVIRVIDTDLVVFVQLQGNGEWVKENLVRLLEATSGLPGHNEMNFQQPAVIVAANATSVLLTPIRETCFFSVELDTLEVERTHERNKYAGPAYPQGRSQDLDR